MDRDGHHFHALFQYMFYTWVQNCTRIESVFNKILNVKEWLVMQRHAFHLKFSIRYLRFYGPVNHMGSCRARSVYLTTPLLGRLSPLSS